MHNSQFFAYASMHPKGKFPGLQAGPAIISHYSLQCIVLAASTPAAIRLSARTHICIWDYFAASTLVSVCALSSG